MKLRANAEPHRADIWVDPVEDLADHADALRNMTGALEHQVPPAFGPRAVPIDKCVLRRLDRIVEITIANSRAGTSGDSTTDNIQKLQNLKEHSG